MKEELKNKILIANPELKEYGQHSGWELCNEETLNPESNNIRVLHYKNDTHIIFYRRGIPRFSMQFSLHTPDEVILSALDAAMKKLNSDNP